MNKKYLKNILLVGCGLGVLTATPIAVIYSTNNSKQIANIYKEYDEKTVVNQMTDQFESVCNQLLSAISSSNNISQKHKNYAQQLFNAVDQDFAPALEALVTKTPDTKEKQDPLEIFQEILVLFHDDVMNGINKLCNSSIVKFLFSEEKINNFKNVWEGILTKQIDLEKYAKENWSLQDIFENILYPLFGEGEQAKKKAWELIFSVYSDTYYTGLNINHENGEVIKGSYELISKPTYTDRYAWNDIKRGDIVFSAQGFAIGGHYSGHCAIVDGWYNAKVNGTNEITTYLRVVEANQFGVAYGLLDDVRMYKEQMSVLHITDANDKQIEAATKFCESQLSKNYNIPIFLSEDVDPNASAWYCSELVWAGYINQGIDIQSNDYYQADIPGILPWEIFYSNSAKIVTSWND